MPLIATASTGPSTAGKLILAAYQMIGYYAANDTLTGADAALGLQQLNMMLDSWSNEALTTFCINEQSFLLTPMKSSYTIGLNGGADIVQQRPIRVMEGPGAAYLQDALGNNYWVNVVTKQTWNQIANRTTLVTSDIPDTLYFDPQFPLAIINLWPTPTIAYTLFFDSFSQFANMANVAQTFSLPPGYELAIESNLALLLAPFCKGSLVSQDVKDIAKYSKANVKRSNKRNNVAIFDQEITVSGVPTYNIYSGRYQ